ncbi:hypothetical protein SAMN05421837_106474 [Amycolatopsis pretoriensis]|uniref:Uncharacterized protein n=1 Tax=Amycolatopsis pretoriensis TaxID=218821 RepID=A0A1H5R383_9PSEU|nr:hypothetical protein [Amycolatopsis pretoriensis]SEF32862.1 hypothetical protein SAMN05421837_106474 [Amycolatopsis pretoriensis]
MDPAEAPPLLDDLTPMEKKVIEGARRGVRTGSGTTESAEALATTDDPALQVRADLLRELLMGRRGELDPRGVSIRGFRVMGRLDLDQVSAVAKLELTKCALPDGTSMRGARLRDLFMVGCVVSSINGDRLRTEGNLKLQGISTSGPIRLLNARIGGQLDLDNSLLKNPAGPAVNMDSLLVTASIFMRGVKATGTGESGTIRMRSAQVNGQVEITGSRIENTSGPALSAERLRVDNSLHLKRSTFSGCDSHSTVRLTSANVVGQLSLEQATLRNSRGAALHADHLKTGGALHLMGANMEGGGTEGVITLFGAQIDARVVLTKMALTGETGRLLNLANATFKQPLTMPSSLICRQAETNTGKRRCASSDRKISVRGFVFTDLEDITWRQWLHLLVHHTNKYFPQPYQQLAATERAAGHDNNARTVLIVQQEDLRRRAPEALGGLAALWRHRIWGWLGRYGYRAHRLVATLLLALVLAGALGYGAGQVTTRPTHHAAERVLPATAPVDAPGTACSTAELIGLGIDRGLPIGATGLRSRCDLDTGTRWGQAFTYAIWVLQALLWALATLAVAAYTGLVRKPA